MLAGDLERFGQRNAGDPTFRPTHHWPTHRPPVEPVVFLHTPNIKIVVQARLLGYCSVYVTPNVHMNLVPYLECKIVFTQLRASIGDPAPISENTVHRKYAAYTEAAYWRYVLSCLDE